MKHALAPTTLAFLLAFAGVTSCNPVPDARASRSVAVAVTGDGFSPSKIQAKRGESLSLVFTRTTDETCAKEVVFPELNVKRDLPLNKAVAIDAPTESARTLTFQCGMGMYKSQLVIQ